MITLRLTPRQRETMLAKCRDGLTNAETGQRMRISHQTIKNHVSQVLKAHGVASTAEICWELSREELAAQKEE